MQKTCTFKNFHACLFCNHYTAKGQGKDRAFSNPKPQLMLTKPKLFISKMDKKVPEVDKNLLSREIANIYELRRMILERR